MRFFESFRRVTAPAPHVIEKKGPPKRGPIMASIGPQSLYPKEDRKFLQDLGAVHVDYYSDVRTLKDQNLKNAGEETYVISEVDSKNKKSTGYRNCTGVAAVGTERGTGQNISLLTHEDPRRFIRDDKEAFTRDFEERLKELFENAEVGSMDIVIFGGNSYNDLSFIGGTYADNYEESIQTLESVIKKITNLDPRIVVGPNQASGDQVDVVLDTCNRRLYIYRPVQPGFSNNIDFKASELEEKKDAWKPHSKSSD